MKTVALFLLTLSTLLTASACGPVSAGSPFQPACYQSFYVLGDTSMVVREAFDVALNLSQASAEPYGVFSLVSSQNASMVYIDQKHNGYTFNPETFTGADAVFMLDRGAVLTLDNWAAPYWSITPGAMGWLVSGSLSAVDGGDYIFTVGGPVNVVRGITDRQNGTGTNGNYLTEMTEVYPVEEGGDEGGRFFVLPVGEDTPMTRDFNGSLASTFRGGTYAIVQSYYDNTVINYTIGGVAQPSATLGRGESMVIPHTQQRDTISSSKKVQVVLFGSGGFNFDTRFFNIPDTRQAGNDYWIPTFPSDMNATVTVRYHVFAFTDAHVTIESSAGTVPGWNGRLIPALANDVTFTTNGSVPLHIYAREGERFMVLVSVDSGSPSYDWGYVPKDSSKYVNSYFIPYAPSGLKSPSDMQLFVLPLYDGTTIFVDYNQDGLVDTSQTLNRFQAYGFYNPSTYYLTGAHIYSDFPFTVVYGESPLAEAGGELPGYDWGYTLLPFDYVSYESALSVTASVDLPVVNPGGTVTFTITIKSSGYIVLGVDAYDLLPEDFTYIPGSSTIVHPDASVTHQDPMKDGQLLVWDLSEDMPGNSIMVITFRASASSSVGYYEDLAYATATDPWDNPLRPEARAYVTVSSQGIVYGYISDATSGSKPLPGVQVSLHDGADDLVGTAVTDGNGLYKFVNLTAGTYRVSYDANDPDLPRLWPLSDSDPTLPAGNPLTSSAPFALPTAGSRTHNFTLSRGIVLMEKQASPDPVERGGEISFTIHYSVPSNAPSTTGNYLADELGAFMIYKVGSLRLNGSPLTDALDSDAGDFGATRQAAVTVNLGVLSPGDSGTVTFSAFVGDAFPGSTVGNTALMGNTKDSAVASASSQTAVSGPPPVTEYVNITGVALNIGYPSPTGIYNLTVRLYGPADLVRETLTTVTGNFSFHYLPVGIYTINYSTSDPAVSSLIPVSDSDGGAPTTGTVNAAVPSTTYLHDFNLTLRPSVGGRVFVDWNLDGTFDENDGPYANATVRLMQGGVTVEETSTLIDGSYAFSGLDPGDYVIAIFPSELYPYRPNSDTDGGLPGEGNLTLLPGTAASHSFALALRLPGINVSKVLVSDGDDCITGTGIVCGSMQFNITITNIGNATLTQIGLVDTYNSTAFTFVSASPTPGFENNATGMLGWSDLTNGSALQPGASVAVMVFMRSSIEFPANTTMNAVLASAYDDGHGVSATASAESGPLQGRVCGSWACDITCILIIIAAIAIILLLPFILWRRRKREEEGP